jgi:transcriptional regulator with XRE-family HTH domain
VARKKKFTETAVRRAINEAGSSVKAVADHLGVTPRTIRNYLNEFNLWQELLISQQLLKMIAAGNVIHAVENGDLDTSKWVLERLGKDEGWAKRTEITGADGSRLLELPPDVLKMMAEEGLDPAKVFQTLRQMLEARAAQKQLPPVVGPGPKQP